MSGARGFTLIEVLVAVVVTALLLMSVYGVFATVDGARQRVEADAGRYHQARVLFDRIGRELDGLYWSAGNRQASFRGGHDREGYPYLELTTTTATPQSAGGGIVVVRYVLQPDSEHDGEQMLVRSERPIFTEEFTPQQTLRMAGGIVGLQLRVFSGNGWREEWDATDGGLPRLLELTLTEAGPDAGVPFVTSFELTPL